MFTIFPDYSEQIAILEKRIEALEAIDFMELAHFFVIPE